MNLSGANERNNFYFGLQTFDTDGISQMRHNDEKDRYRNNTLVAHYSYIFSDKFEVSNNARVAETYLQYDAVACCSGFDHSEEADGVEGSYNINFIYKPIKNFTNKFTFCEHIYKKNL